MHHHTDRKAYTTAFVTPVVEHWLEWEIVQWVHPMKDRSDDPSHHERNALTTELHLAPSTKYLQMTNNYLPNIFSCFGYQCLLYVSLFIVRLRLVVIWEQIVTHAVIGCQIEPSWWTHWAISSSSQYLTGVTNAVICAILYVGWCI